MAHRSSVLKRWLLGAAFSTASLPALAQTPAATSTPETAPGTAPAATAAPAPTPPASPAAAAAPAPTPAKEQPKKPAAGPFVLASEDGAHRLEFKGLIQADGRFFLTDRGGVSSFVLR